MAISRSTRTDGALALTGVLAALCVWLVGGVHHVRDASVTHGFAVLATMVILHRGTHVPGRPRHWALLPAAVGVFVAAMVGPVFIWDQLGPAIEQLAMIPFSVVGICFGLALLSRRQMNLGDKAAILQMIAEIILLYSIASLVAWRLVFSGLMPISPIPDSVLVIDVVLSCALFSVGVMGAAREPDLRILLIGCGVALLGLSALVGLYFDTRGLIPWPGQVLGIIGWTVIVLGVPGRNWMERAAPTDPTKVGRMEARRIYTLAPLVALLTLLAFASLLAPPALSLVEGILSVLFVLALAARDMVQASRSGHLLSRIRSQSLQDPLTRLRNRRGLQADIQELDQARVSVLTIDLDDFKAVNDLLGHSTGDLVLRAAGAALQTLAQRCGGTAYRLGGDEFAVLATIEPQAAEEVAGEAIRQITRAAGEIRGVARIGMTSSIGVCHVPAQPRVAQAVTRAIVQSGHAMRAAKVDGKGRVHIFDDTLQEEYRRRKHIELRLRAGLSQVQLEYQPVISLHTDRVVAVEALARWRDDVLGEISPEEFIRVAEDSGLIEELGEHLLTEAMTMMPRLPGPTPVTMAVNVSPLQLRLPDFVSRVMALVHAHDIDPDQLLLEVTETQHLRTDGPEARALRQLSAHGVLLAIDDFGAGSTAIGYLAELPVSVIKIDKSLTSASSRASIGIVRGIIAMSKDLGKQVTIEGVETAEQWELARQVGADYVQGWLFSGAVSATALPETLATLNRLTSVPAQAKSSPQS